MFFFICTCRMLQRYNPARRRRYRQQRHVAPTTSINRMAIVNIRIIANRDAEINLLKASLLAAHTAADDAESAYESAWHFIQQLRHTLETQTSQLNELLIHKLQTV